MSIEIGGGGFTKGLAKLGISARFAAVGDRGFLGPRGGGGKPMGSVEVVAASPEVPTAKALGDQAVIGDQVSPVVLRVRSSCSSSASRLGEITK